MQHRVETRHKDRPYSSLSWHDLELNDLEMRARRRKAQKNVNAMRMSMQVITRLKGMARASRKSSSGVVTKQKPSRDNNDEDTEEEGTRHSMHMQHGVLVPLKNLTDHSRPVTSPTNTDVDNELAAIQEDDESNAVTSQQAPVDPQTDPPPSPSEEATVKSQARILRPQSAPFKTFSKYCAASRASSRASHSRQLHSAPPGARNFRVATHARKPAPAFVAPDMRTVTSGPNSSTLSLLQDRPRVERSNSAHARRTAWSADATKRKYYYPSDPSKERVHDAYRKLVRNLHTRTAHSRLLLCSNYPTHPSTERY